MRVFISGICGFAGSIIARRLLDSLSSLEVIGIDNLMRPGSELNRHLAGVRVVHGDIRLASDLDSLPNVDWVIDAAANPSVLAGIDDSSSSRRLIEHNLYGTINLLELCKRSRAGLILLSTSRVYSIQALSSMPLETWGSRFRPSGQLPNLTKEGIGEKFSTASPVSLYGATKLASEVMASEYGSTFQFPVVLNRCGVLAGAGQFGTAEQGIFSYWIHAWHAARPLRYIGFDGKGRQVRDALHPEDLAQLIVQQISTTPQSGCWNVAGGVSRSMSLWELSSWCENRFGEREVASEACPRPFDLPWVVLDSAKGAKDWNWRPTRKIESILEEIALHAESNLGWLKLTTN